MKRFDYSLLGGSVISLTYVASEKVIPGYGGGMSSAKAALESDTRVLAFEVILGYLLIISVNEKEDKKPLTVKKSISASSVLHNLFFLSN